MKLVNTTYKSTEDMINKLQEIKGKTKSAFYKKNNYYEEMKKKNFQTQQDPFAKNSQGISKIYHEVLLSRKFLQTKPQNKNTNINYFDLYYTVIKIRDENQDIVNQSEDDNNDYIDNNDVNIPNHYVGKKEGEK